jgi:hypothetical protein
LVSCLREPLEARKKITVLFEDWTLRAEGAHKSYVFSEKVFFSGLKLAQKYRDNNKRLIKKEE